MIFRSSSPHLPPKGDRTTNRKFRDGDIQIDGRLDMHGMTEAAAHRALSQFLRQHIEGGSRQLLVITGRGKDGTGVLRRQLPLWLEALGEGAAVHSLRPAALKHGGDGAFYITLKRQRT